jgi:hypothetical protein
MGPHQCGALLLVTSINSETPQRVAQKLRVPRHMLSHTMQQLHQNGIRSGDHSLYGPSRIAQAWTAITSPPPQIAQLSLEARTHHQEHVPV